MKTLRFLLIGLLALCLLTLAKAQEKNGSIKGTVTVAKTGEAIPYANIVLKDSTGAIISGANTDRNGKYDINPVSPGTYDVEASFTGYASLKVEDIVISPDTSSYQDFKLRPETQVLQEVVISYEAPLIEKSKSSSIITREDASSMAVRDASRKSSKRAPNNDQELRLYYEKAPPSNNSPQSREAYAHIEELPFRKVQDAPLSTFSSDVDAASYANFRRFINDGYLPPADAVRIEEMINYFEYDYPQPAEGEVFSMTSELGACPWKEEHQLLRIGLKTADIDPGEFPEQNLVFLIDVSGSMRSADKLPLLKRSLRLLVDNLQEDDHVAIVVYAGAAGQVLSPTAGNKKAEIQTAIDQLAAGGSTAGGAGIKLAYKLARKNLKEEANNRVILATDGDFNVGMSSDGEMIRLIEKERESGVFLTVLGFGTGNLQDAKMEQIADHGNGHYAYIDNLMEAHKVLVTEMGASLNTVAKDTKFQIEFNPANVKAYRLIGYENRMLNDEDFNDDTKDAGDVGSGHDVTAVYEIIPSSVKAQTSLPSVDPLKYQTGHQVVDPEHASELATLKIRYKHPDEDESVLRTQVISNSVSEKPSPDFQFICGIMETGMLLRDSKYKGESSFEEAKLLAKAGKGNDPHGYRGEFIRLIDMADKLKHSSSIGSR